MFSINSIYEIDKSPNLPWNPSNLEDFVKIMSCTNQWWPLDDSVLRFLASKKCNDRAMLFFLCTPHYHEMYFHDNEDWNQTLCSACTIYISYIFSNNFPELALSLKHTVSVWWTLYDFKYFHILNWSSTASLFLCLLPNWMLSV